MVPGRSIDPLKKASRVGYKAIETGVVSGYKTIENGVVGGFNKITDKSVGTFLTKKGETVEQVKERPAAEQKARVQGK